MNAPPIARQSPTPLLCYYLLLLLSPLVAGCGDPDSETEQSKTTYSPSPTQSEPETNPLLTQPPSRTENLPTAAAELDSASSAANQDVAATPSGNVSTTPSPGTMEGGQTIGSDKNSTALPFRIAGTDPEAKPSLKPDLKPLQLVDFLADADQDIQIIFSGRSGIEDPNEARDTLIRIVKKKLEASRRLAKHVDANEKQKSEGARGELQSLSHLAALGDVKVAEELEKQAESNLSSDDPRLVSDSRLVLIGFALEALRNGNEEAPNRIVQYFRQIESSPTKPGVPALLIMGQARQMLASYGHEEQAMLVRKMIIDLFADSQDPEIARMAAQLAGSVHFDAIEKQRTALLNGESIPVDQWRDSVIKLVEESADMQTVQYLAGAALEIEGQGGHDDIIDATYEVLNDKFSDPDSATGREVMMATDAKQARKEVIGRTFKPDLPKTDGSPMPMTDFVGKVVLMPFWASGFPESLQLLPQLKAIREAHPDQVEIVGINLDAEGAPVEEFLAENNFDFPSLRAESSPTANPVASSFGMVSLPFVAILDSKGKVAALNFTGQGLEKTVNNLLQR